MLIAVIAVIAVVAAAQASAQIAPPRTWPELKEAWVTAEGGHIGRNKEWSDLRIMREVIAPWFAQQLK